MKTPNLFKIIPLAATAALALSAAPLQARPGGGGHGGGGHSGGGHVGHAGGGAHFHGGHVGRAGGGVHFGGGRAGFRGGHAIVHGGHYRGHVYHGRPWGGWCGGPYWGLGLGLGYPYYAGYPYSDGYDYGYADPGVTNSTQVDDTASSVQEALANAGYYHGAIDGIIGPGTTAAIAAYQRSHGLRVTGAIDSRLLQSLGIS